MGIGSLGADIGLALSGGDIDRQGAHLEGLDVGSKIQSRKANTVNALAQARLRKDEAEARVGLADQLDLGGNQAIAAFLRAGGNPEQMTGAQLDQQQFGFRDEITDLGNSFEQRQAFAQGVEGKVVDPFQYGPGGELFNSVFSDENPTLSQTGGAQIGLDESNAGYADARAQVALETMPYDIAAEQAKTRAANARAGYDEARTADPAKYKSGVNISMGSLGDDVLADIGESTMPDELNPAEATGVSGALKSIQNTAYDIVNQDLPWPDADIAGNALNDLHKRTMIVGQQSVPGRPSNYLMQAFETFGVSPNDPFRSDQRSMTRLAQTSRYLGGEIDRIRRELNQGLGTTTIIAKNASALRNLARLKQDFDVVISRFDATTEARGQGLADDVSPPSRQSSEYRRDPFADMGVGETQTINGITVRRKD